MKPSISVDFLRGILFAFVAYSCYQFGNALWFSSFPRLQTAQVGIAGLLLIVHLVLLTGLLFQPARSAKAVFVFLALFCLVPIGSAIYWMNYPLRELPRSPFTPHFLSSLFVSIAVAVIAYIHYRARQQQRHA
jgi:hypothetical protein